MTISNTETSQPIRLVKSKTYPELKDNAFYYPTTTTTTTKSHDGQEKSDDIEGSKLLLSDVKILYLYKEQGIGTDSDTNVDMDSVALQTGQQRTRMADVVKGLFSCIRKNRE